GWKRVFTSKSFHLLVFLFFGVHYRDIDCSFKLMNRKFLDSLNFKTRGGLIDSEIYVHARKTKAKVAQVGVHHYLRPYGESQCLKAGLIFSMLRDLFILRIKLWRK
ncbi:MAG: hypothetical protein KC649_05405, partial [Candidatus Omnitrophica bacterium]|nr:hypothetical protein [Candidatus Omnitrophota bacterium]